jgi:hypothetical protein
MSGSDSSIVIKQIRSNKSLLADVAKWMFMKGHHKMFNECKGIYSKDCEKVGLRSTFTGKKCHTCFLAYKKQQYRERKSQKK